MATKSSNSNSKQKSSGKAETNEASSTSSDVLPPLDVDPAYNWAADKFRQMTSTSLMCAFGCGGSKCKWCHPVGRFQEKDYVIKGLYSNWVPPHFVAVSRPTTETVRDFDIPQQFLDLGIKGIFNLQSPGEHGQCYPLGPSGFSYNPEDFMAKGIFFYNYAWPDFGIPNINELIDVVQVVDFSVALGKVAVHCHAGKGRTCALIACYLVYVHRVPSSAAICYLRKHRAGSIQTRGQVMLIRNFECFLQPYWILFPRVELNCKPRSLETVLAMQKKVYHGYERKRLMNIPKFVYISCKLLLYLAGVVDSSFWDSMGGIGAGARFPSELAQIVELYFGSKSSKKSSVESEGRKPADGKQTLITPFSEMHRTKSSENFLNLAGNSAKDTIDGAVLASSKQSVPLSARTIQGSDVRLSNYDMRLDDEIDVGPSSIYPLESIMDVSSDRRMNSLKHQKAEFITSDSPDASNDLENLERLKMTSPITQELRKSEVVDALFCEYQEIAVSVRKLEQEMNDAPRCWDLLKKVENPKLVAGTLWDWFDQLEFPVLTSRNLEDIVMANRQFLFSVQDEKSLIKFLNQCITKQAAETVATVLSLLSQLSVESQEKLKAVIDLVLTHFTHVGINGVRPGSGNRSGHKNPLQSSKSPKKKKELWDKAVKLLCSLVNKMAGSDSNDGPSSNSDHKSSPRIDKSSLPLTR